MIVLLLDFVNSSVRKYYPNLASRVKITLLELLDHILNTYDARISDCKYTTTSIPHPHPHVQLSIDTEKHFMRSSIEVLTKSQVSNRSI